jgi:hypothetical protein
MTKAAANLAAAFDSATYPRSFALTPPEFNSMPAGAVSGFFPLDLIQLRSVMSSPRELHMKFMLVVRLVLLDGSVDTLAC